MDWIRLTWYRIQWWILMYTVMNLRKNREFPE
jgi:hypothetical protein